MSELKKSLRTCFDRRGLSVPLRFFDTTESTNDEAKRYAREVGGEAVFIAERQTAGRGRLGRSFSSEAGGLYFSYLHYPDAPPSDAVMLTVFAAVCVCLTVEELVPGARPTIKWVNDVRIGDRKLAGILAEGAFSEDGGRFLHAVTGIGVNLHSRTYPDEIKDIATDLEREYGVRVPIGEFAALLYEKLSGFASADKSEYLEAYRRRSCVIGRRVTVMAPDGAYEALAIGITDRGELSVKTDNGEVRHLYTGEVGIKI